MRSGIAYGMHVAVGSETLGWSMPEHDGMDEGFKLVRKLYLEYEYNLCKLHLPTGGSRACFLWLNTAISCFMGKRRNCEQVRDAASTASLP